MEPFQGRVLSAGVAMYEEALTYDPKCAEALYNLAVVHGESKQIRRAILMYEMCLLVKPDCAEAHNNLGVLYRGMGNVEKAYLCYMAALHINPKFHQALSNVAVLYTSQVPFQSPTVYISILGIQEGKLRLRSYT